jgi:hypothetical protein
MAHVSSLDIFGPPAGDVAGTIVAKQPGLVLQGGAVAAWRRERHAQRVGDAPGSHVGAQLPGDDGAREVVEHGRQLHPAPAEDLEGGKISMPQLVNPRGLGVELIGRLDDDIGWAGDQVIDVWRDTVPHPARRRWSIFQRFWTAFEEATLPAVGCLAGDG